MAWMKTTEARYWEMLEVLPPEIMTGNGFLVGEPSDHRMCKVTNEVEPRFAAFVEVNRQFFEHDEPMTIPEFKATKLADILKAA